MIPLSCKAVIDCILNNSALTLIIGLLLGVSLTAWSTTRSNKFNEKMWIKDKRLYYYSKSLDDIKCMSKIIKNINARFYHGENGEKARKDDFVKQKEMMDDFFTSFRIVAEKDVFSAYEKVYKEINSNECSDFDSPISEYQEKITSSIMKGIKK